MASGFFFYLFTCVYLFEVGDICTYGVQRTTCRGRDPIWDPEAELGIRLAAPSLPTRSSFWSLWLQV